MSSKQVLNREIQGRDQAIADLRKHANELAASLQAMMNERNGFAAAVRAMTTQLARQEAAHAETAVLLRQEAARWREKAARRRRGHLGRAWIRFVAALRGKQKTITEGTENTEKLPVGAMPPGPANPPRGDGRDVA